MSKKTIGLILAGAVAVLSAWADQPDQPKGRKATGVVAKASADDGAYDLVVLGDGPGALTAAYAGGRKKLRVCWVRGSDEVAIPRIGEKLTLNLGPMFRLSAPMFHLMTFADTPNMLLNEMRAITNLTICARRDAGVFERAADGSIESFTFLDGTNRVTVSGRVWADGGQLGRTGDCQQVELSDMVNHNESHFSTSFYNNIVHWETGTLDSRDYKRGVPGIARIFSDYNLFSGSGAKKLRETHPEVGAGGVIDQHSVWADAGFVDAAKRDFRLKGDSPALKMGFEPVDWSKAGPRVTFK